MTPVPLRLSFALAGAAVLASGTFSLSLLAQVAGDNNNGADLSPKPPIVARTAAEQAKSFVLPPGYRMELVLSDPDIVNPAVIEFDGNGRMYVVEFVTYMPDVDGNRQREPRQPHHALGRHQRRRHVRQANRLRRQAGAAAHGAAARQGQHPHQRDRLGRRDQVDRHQRGRRRRQARDLLHGRRPRPRRQPRAHAERVRVGPRQLDLQHLQRLPFPLDADGILREPTGTNGGQWGLSQDDDGKMWFV